MKMKEILALLLVGIVALGLVACGGKNVNEAIDDTQQEENMEAVDEIVKEEVETVVPDMNESTDVAVIPKGAIEIKELSGKTIADIVSMGYELRGVSSIMGDTAIMFTTKTFSDDVMTYQSVLEGKTVAELRSKYDISLSNNHLYNNRGTITMEMRDAYFSCEIDGAKEIYDAHSDDRFFDLEEAEEIQDKIVENVEIITLTVYVVLDDDSATKLEGADNVINMVKEISSELTVKSASYTLVR